MSEQKDKSKGETKIDDLTPKGTQVDDDTADALKGGRWGAEPGGTGQGTSSSGNDPFPEQAGKDSSLDPESPKTKV
jgi:hypothetical protein